MSDIEKQSLTQSKQKKDRSKRVGKYKYNPFHPIHKLAWNQLFSAINLQTQQEVTMKVVKKPITDDSQKLKIFEQKILREVEIMKKLKSQNIIQYIDVTESVNNIYIIQQFANSGVLSQFIKKKPQQKMNEDEAVQVLSQILKGIKQLINVGVLHRDLKMENIIVHQKQDKKILYKIFNFELSNYPQEIEKQHDFVGTPIYMAPEIIKKSIKKQNSASNFFKYDIWSLGILAFKLVSINYPWDTEKNIHSIQEFQSMLSNKYKQGYPFINQINTSKNYKDFIRGCLQYQQKNRFDWNDVFHHPLFGQKFKDIHFEQEMIQNVSYSKQKHTKELINKLSKFIKQNSINIQNFKTKYSCEGKNPNITRQQMSQILKTICKKDLSEQQLNQYIQIFNIQKTKEISFNSFYELLQQIHHIQAQQKQTKQNKNQKQMYQKEK